MPFWRPSEDVGADGCASTTSREEVDVRWWRGETWRGTHGKIVAGVVAA